MLSKHKGLLIAGLMGMLLCCLFISEIAAQGGGTSVSIVIMDDLLRVTSSDQEDPVIRIEIWQGNTLMQVESPCGGQLCETHLGGLPAGLYQAKAFAQSGASASGSFSR